MEFDPTLAIRIATDLDDLANRLESDLRANASALAAPAPGLDEVSLRAAATLGEVASSFDLTSTSGVVELRRLAATLRAQSRELVGMDSGNAVDFGTPA